MSNCTRGCKTQDHESYGDCLRSKGAAVMGLESTGNSYSAQKKWDAELDLYRTTRAQGIQPETTRTKDIRKALDASDQTGKAYQAVT